MRARTRHCKSTGVLLLSLFGCSFGSPSEEDVFGGPKHYRPAPGTYTYDTELTQTFAVPKLLSNAIDLAYEGFSLVNVASEDDGCFRIRFNVGVDPNPSFWEESSFCSQGGNLTRDSIVQMSKLENFNSTTTTTISCDPPALYIQHGMKPGDQWNVVCTGQNSTVPPAFDFSYPFQSAGTYTYVRDENVTVGQRELATFHFVEERQVSGTNPAGPGLYVGTQSTLWWFSRDTGLPLKRTSTVQVETDTGPDLGSLQYEETSSWVLLAEQPSPPKDAGTEAGPDSGSDAGASDAASDN